MRWQIKTPPTEPALAIEAALIQANLAGYDGCAPYDAPYIQQLIERATSIVEEEENRQLVTAVWLAFFDRFPTGRAVFEIAGKLPVRSIDSIKYTDTDGAPQTLDPASYEVDAVDLDRPARIRPVEGATWPGVGSVLNAVEIEATCGYGDDAEAMPPAVTHCLAGLVSEMWNYRESVAPGTIAKIPGNMIDRALGLLNWGNYA